MRPLTTADDRRPVETSLLEQPPQPGDWLLVHVNVAIRALDAGEAGQISDALLAVTRAAAGESFEHLLADLIDREPQLPAHLRQGFENMENQNCNRCPTMNSIAISDMLERGVLQTVDAASVDSFLAGPGLQGAVLRRPRQPARRQPRRGRSPARSTEGVCRRGGRGPG